VAGSVTMAVIGHSSGTMARAIGVGGINNTIADGEMGVGFFRFMMTTGATVRTHIGLIADTGTNPVNATRTADPMTVPAGLRLVDNGNGFDLLTTDGAAVLKPAGLQPVVVQRLDRGRPWPIRSICMSVRADRPAGAATLPNPEDLVKAALPSASRTPVL
jgi:hypothetical protein